MFGPGLRSGCYETNHHGGSRRKGYRGPKPSNVDWNIRCGGNGSRSAILLSHTDQSQVG